jgi:hypothetical protein
MRTAAQRMGDRKRSHRAKAKREQKVAAQMYLTYVELTKCGLNMNGYRSALTMTATMARKHLNFVLSGEYADFTE